VSALQLTVIGAGAAYTRVAGNVSSCYLLESQRGRVVLELGQGSFASLGALRDPASLDAVVVSHLHPDHHIDLVPLRHYLRFAAQEHEAVALHAPGAIGDRYDGLTAEPGFLDVMPLAPLVEGVRSIADLRLQVACVTHTDDSYAFRIAVEGAETGLVYSGDCGDPDELLALVRPGDTLLSEASWGIRESIPGVHHLTAAQAAQAAAARGAARLILTHILDEGDPERSLAVAQELAPDLEVLLARPGLTITVP
jgi:ribonuclease BN (tRNA processing enzyme)